MEGLLFVTQKKNGDFKGRIAYNCKPTREWITGEDKSLPTVATEIIFLNCGVDTVERRNMMTIDVKELLRKKSRNERVT